jgi:hypothetical protein
VRCTRSFDLVRPFASPRGPKRLLGSCEVSDAVLISLVVTIGTIVTATIGAVGIVIANRTLAQARSTHHLINSRVDELLESARLLARAEGVEAGEQAARERSE